MTSPPTAPKPAPKRKEPADHGASAAPPKEKKPRTSAAKESKPAKVYDLPGQTRDTPEEVHCKARGCWRSPHPAQNDPLRKFYTSTLEQRPDSAMARKWCVMYGLLSREDAQAWVDEVKGSKGGRYGRWYAASCSAKVDHHRHRTPVKAKPAAVKKEASTAKKKAPASAVKQDVKPKAKPALIMDDDSSDDDVPLGQRKIAA